MKNILITGASGFVGKNLVKYLSEFNIIQFSRIYGLDYNLITEEYLNKNEVDTIIHLAGKAHDLKKNSKDDDYFKINTDLTIKIFDSFLNSNGKQFIYLSSVKAVKDFLDFDLTEDIEATPISIYGQSKLTAEKYLQTKLFNLTYKRVHILRPCMIHGPENKGNLNMLYKLVSKNIPWPLGAFKNQRSFCSIDNFSFIIKELLNNENIISGIYNVADDNSLSINEIIDLIAFSQNRKSKILNIKKPIIFFLVKIGDFLRLPFNSENLKKLTENYVVSNDKIKNAIGKELPLNSKEGLLITFSYFNK